MSIWAIYGYLFMVKVHPCAKTKPKRPSCLLPSAYCLLACAKRTQHPCPSDFGELGRAVPIGGKRKFVSIGVHSWIQNEPKSQSGTLLVPGNWPLATTS